MAVAFAAICRRHLKALFYTQGNFPRFSEDDRARLHADLATVAGADLVAHLAAFEDALTARGFGGRNHRGVSPRALSMARFRRLLAALLLAWERGDLASAEEGSRHHQADVDAWFAPAPAWLLRRFVGSGAWADLRATNRDLAMAAESQGAGVAPGAAADPTAFLATVRETLAPNLLRRHFMFWRSAQDQAALTRASADPWPERALGRKLADAVQAVSAEIGDLEAVLAPGVGAATGATAPAAASAAATRTAMNALAFHVLAWVAWSEPVRSRRGAELSSDITPGFRPVFRLIEGLARTHARWAVARAAPHESPEDVTAEITAGVVQMFEGDRFRGVVNLHAAIAGASKRIAADWVKRTSAATPEVRPEAWRSEAGTRSAVSLETHTPEVAAAVRRELLSIWCGLETRLLGLLEEEDPARLRMTPALFDECVRDDWTVLARLDVADDDVLVAWYWTAVLRLDTPALRDELTFRQRVIDPVPPWLHELAAVTPRTADGHRARVCALLFPDAEKGTGSGPNSLEAAAPSAPLAARSRRGRRTRGPNPTEEDA